MVARRYCAEIDSDAGSVRVGSRDNRAGEFGALYLAESEDACRSEVACRIEPEVMLSLGTLEAGPPSFRAQGHTPYCTVTWTLPPSSGR